MRFYPFLRKLLNNIHIAIIISQQAFQKRLAKYANLKNPDAVGRPVDAVHLNTSIGIHKINLLFYILFWYNKREKNLQKEFLSIKIRALFYHAVDNVLSHLLWKRN